ncbi:MAG: ferrous iron transport protein B [Proteobacteria bacterium]|nr:ferrous iron transport protein B [Pseudomonadota bacterium]
MIEAEAVPVPARAKPLAARPVVAIAGNPNTGKSTLFNRLTGLSARVGNYPGITVDLLSGTTRLAPACDVELLDVPGSYSLVARSAEEQLAIDRLLGLVDGKRPAAVIVCVDATNLVRNLYLLLQLQELGLNTLVALTMTDEAPGVLADAGPLSHRLGCPVVATVPRRGQGIDELKQRLAELLDTPPLEPRRRWTPSSPLRRELARIRAALPSHWPASDGLALWALMSLGEGDGLRHVPDTLRAAVGKSPLDGEAVDDEAVQGRYAWLDREIAPLLSPSPRRALTERVDAAVLHPVVGFGIFLLLMFMVFQSLFAWADPVVTGVEWLLAGFSELVSSLLPEGIINAFICEAVIGGVGSVLVFLPQILLLFLFIGLMEDSGYLARVAYLMDRIMKLMRLNGRAFVPMLSGFACAVPAIMATRTMERRRDRLLTMMVVPLMTCSARLPVYTLIIGALFPASAALGFVSVQGALMIAMYLFSVLMALGAAWVLSRTALRAAPVPLLLELPPYRLPRMADVLRMMWRRSKLFLTEAGTVILGCTIVLWVLLSFPQQPPNQSELDARLERAESAEAAEAIEQERAGARLRSSYAGRLGRLIEPAIEPLGFDWKIGVGLVGAFAAREVFVSTMGVVYNLGAGTDERSTTLRDRLKRELREDGTRTYTPLVGLSLMVFFALACQCMSTLAVVKHETGGFRWPSFMFVYMTLLAWTASFLVFQGGRLLGWQ